MRVVTLAPEAFRRDCTRLGQRAVAFAPELLVGIRTGGFVVAEQMRETCFPAVPLLPLTRRRPGSDTKRAHPALQALLHRLPYAVTDGLRRLEHRLLTRRAPRPAGAPWQADADELAALERQLAATRPARILVVDDAVDSGETLRAVVGLLRRLAPAVSVRAAAIVVTTEHPAMHPDFHLYAQTLCRFPWSHDYRLAPGAAVRPR